jgi:two-component system sensor histidine kinase DesK
MGTMAMSPKVKSRIAGTLWSAAWMLPLLGPAVAVAQGQVPHPLLAGAGLAAFVAIYLVVVVNALEDDRRVYLGPPRLDVVGLVAVAAIGVGLFVAYANNQSGWWDLMLYVSVAGAAALPSRSAVAWTLGAVAVTLAWGLSIRGDHLGDALSIVIGTLLASALVHVVQRMQHYNRILRDTRAELARNAVSEERLRFARDLHDLLGHTMSLIVVKAEVVRRLVDRDPALAAQAAADIEAIGRRALSEVRQAVDGYRAPDFAAALDGVRSALADAGITVRVRHDGPPVPAAASQLFGWVVREAATNVIRHSGATSADMRIAVTPDEAVLEIRDDGRGRRAEGGGDASDRIGNGLAGLRERVTSAGGAFVAENVPGRGFRVEARLPAEEAQSTDAQPDEPARFVASRAAGAATTADEACA